MSIGAKNQDKDSTAKWWPTETVQIKYMASMICKVMQK